MARYRIIAFDWDGTAVASREDDATPVRGPIERLLRCGVLVVVITGTHIGHIEAQLSRAIRGRHKRNLYLAANRGSEVYGFADGAGPEALWRRVATVEEERALTEIADGLRQLLRARTGLDVRVIYDRLNRRKIDLIPLERWADPPKAEIGELLVAVETRLRDAGVAGGIREVVELARTLAAAQGLPDARVTTDVKHVEVGLTDKGDSMRWVMRELAGPLGVDPAQVLIAGDELGPLAGVPGSDSYMLVDPCRGARVVSVGPEPGGVPGGVEHLGGGPARLRALLAEEAALHPVTLPAVPVRDPAWTLVEHGFVLAREHEIESLFAIGNGFVGTRGSLAEGSALSAPATFVAGVFEAAPGAVPGLLVAPDWARLKGGVDGHTLLLEDGDILEHRRVLDLRQGISWRFWRQRDPSGRVTQIAGLRLASLADRHLLLQSVSFTPENYGGLLTIEGLALARALPLQTTSGISVELVADTRIEDPEGSWTPPASEDIGGPERWSLRVELGRTYRLDRVACVETSREAARSEQDAALHLHQSHEGGFEAALEAHVAAWRARWASSDVVIDGDPGAQRAIRFAAYHLISAANPEDERVSIGARGLTGGAYKGHVFWDTDIYMLPFFTLTYPEAARALVMYRYHTLPAARARAARHGHRGAMYAWESADSGDDVTPPFVLTPDGQVVRLRVGDQEQHISADVAYGAWSYWHATHDHGFLLAAGAEIVLETARFWSSRIRRERDGRGHIHGVIGPDEYHETVDDDAYTNGMAQWNLETGAELAELLARRWPEQWRELSERLRLAPDEPDAWRAAARDLYVGLDSETGVIEQFRGYFALAPPSDATRSAPFHELAGLAEAQRTQVVKQPDVLMLLYLLWDRFEPRVRAACFRYYEPRTVHGSSLSPPIHAALAARLGELELAARYFEQTCAIDLANTMGNASGGVHLAALGGLWQAVVFGFAGLSLAGPRPRVRARLPAGWRGLELRVRWRGREVPFSLRRAAPEVRP